MMRVQKTKIGEIWNNLDPNSLTITFLNNTPNEYSYNGANVKSDLLYKYGERFFNSYTEDGQTYIEFMNLWNLYKIKNKPNYDRMFTALIAEYSPIENYDRTETTNKTLTGGHQTTDTSKIEYEAANETTFSGGHSTEVETETVSSDDGTTTKTGGHTVTDAFDDQKPHKSVIKKSGGHETEESNTGGHESKITREGGHHEDETKTGGYSDTESYVNYGSDKRTTGGYTDSLTHGEVITESVSPENNNNFYNTNKAAHTGSDTTTRTYDTTNGLDENTTYNGTKTTSRAYDTLTGDKLSKEFYYNDVGGETETTTYKIDPLTGEKKKTTFNYNEINGEVEETTETGRKTSDFSYNAGGEKEETNVDTSTRTQTNEFFSYNSEKQENTNSYQLEHSGGIKKEYLQGGEKENITSHIHGNIGVTTNQQMIEAELDLRKQNIIDMYITGFIKEYTFIF